MGIGGLRREGAVQRPVWSGKGLYVRSRPAWPAPRIIFCEYQNHQSWGAADFLSQPRDPIIFENITYTSCRISEHRLKITSNHSTQRSHQLSHIPVRTLQ